ncbi:MAG: FKBP-type peptidyl-prolyl cis-trans isomerase [Flavobacteriales bacterium]|nr:FKBP-type peptidyl-prolyl cis-trans isomerase [Flavobacteriales bacterium]
MKLKFSVGILVVLLLASCGSDSRFKGFTRAKENGLHYKFFHRNEDGKAVELGGGIYFGYIISTYDKDSVVVNSKDVSKDGSGYTNFGIQASSFVGSFEDALLMMHEGDSAAFVVPADSFFTKTMGLNELPPGIKPGMFLKGVFAVKKVITKQEMEDNQKAQMAEQEKMLKEIAEREKADRDKYLTENNITTEPTPSGLIYIELKKGNGKKPTATDVVKVHYTGKLLNGTVFDSSVERGEPVEFGLNQVISGWTEGLQLMGIGGKAKLIIPSTIGYGPMQQGPIPGGSTLVFEVELLDIVTPKPMVPPQGE